jgi:hypothetical protein
MVWPSPPYWPSSAGGAHLAVGKRAYRARWACAPPTSGILRKEIDEVAVRIGRSAGAKRAVAMLHSRNPFQMPAIVVIGAFQRKTVFRLWVQLAGEFDSYR